jgi:hypothetical protein
MALMPQLQSSGGCGVIEWGTTAGVGGWLWCGLALTGIALSEPPPRLLDSFSAVFALRKGSMEKMDFRLYNFAK